MPAREPITTTPDPVKLVQIGVMTIERAAHQSTLLKTGQVLVTGGCGGNHCDQVFAEAELFDPITQSFRVSSPMSVPRAGHAAIALPDGRVLVSGGWTGQEPTSSAEVYDPAIGQWMAIGDMVVARAGHITVLLPDGRVLVMGGGSGGLGDLASVEVFDAVTSTFSPMGWMRTNHYLATVLGDGRVLMTGGQGAAGEILRTAEIFDPAIGEFLPTGEMLAPRVNHASALLADGRVLLIGGSDERSSPGRYKSTEIYEPEIGAFLPGPDMAWSRHKIRDAVVVLPSGAILVAGGAVHLELFDPVHQVFTQVEGELSGPQIFATATLLTTGEVLVLGGYDERTQSSASAWLVQNER